MKNRLAKKIFKYCFTKNNMSLFDASFCVKPYNKTQIKKAISRLNKWACLASLETVGYKIYSDEFHLCPPKVDKRVRFRYRTKAQIEFRNKVLSFF